jgi:hypothetical protein
MAEATKADDACVDIEFFHFHYASLEIYDHDPVDRAEFPAIKSERIEGGGAVDESECATFQWRECACG